jgi:EAL domain-containing protein (putative c-di-GMP-specific phosphodiesterase class I)
MNAPAEFTPSMVLSDTRRREALPELSHPTAEQTRASFLEQMLHNAVRQDGSRAVATFRDYRLDSAFQPIFGLAHHRPVGYEALLRATDTSGAAVSPLQVFASAETTEGIVHLDRTCRILHTQNYRPLAAPDRWLFLNINPRVVVEGSMYGPFFAELLTRSALRPPQVVVEILENEITDEGLLADAVSYYKDLGCLVAIDDFGAGHSNFDRILRLAPDMVKLDRGLMQHARHNPAARRMLPGLVTLLHEAGCLVVMEGIEDEAEALLAIEADADFAQGFFFARPAAAELLTHASASAFATLNDTARARLHDRAARHAAALQPCIDAFRQCAGNLAAGDEITAASAALFTAADVLRCYVLDGNGIQVGSNAVAPTADTTPQPRFAPLRETAGCDWSGRSYFRRAVSEPGTVQVTRPYFSVTDAAMNITLSMAIGRNGGLRVVCCDIRHPLRGT